MYHKFPLAAAKMKAAFFSDAGVWVTAVSGLTLWKWRPVLETISDIATLLTPPCALALVAVQFVYWIKRNRKK